MPSNSSPDRLSAVKRLHLIQLLNALPVTQFEELVFGLNPPPGLLPPGFAAQGNRTSTLLQWAEGSTGPGLGAVQEMLGLIAGSSVLKVSEGQSRLATNVQPLSGLIDMSQFASLTKLEGDQYERLEQALVSAFPTQEKLKRMVRIGFNKPLQSVAEGANHTERVDNLIDWAESEGLLPQLVAAALQQNPGNPDLQVFIDSLSATHAEPKAQGKTLNQGPSFDWRGPTDERQLEGLLRPQRDVSSYNMEFIQRASQPAAAVCRIELPNQEAIGTGFLIAKNLVLTNYHVIAPYDDSDPTALLGQITLRFGYLTEQTDQGAAGQTFALAPDSLLRFKTVEDGLDYALLQVEDRILTAQG